MPYAKAIGVRGGALAGAGRVRLSVALLMVAAFALPASVLLGAYALDIRDVVVASCALLSLFLSLHEKRGWGGPFVMGFVLFCVFSLVSVFWASSISDAYVRLVDLALAVLLGVAIAANGPSLRETHLILNALLVGTILISVISLWIDFSTLSGWSRLGGTLFESAGSNITEYSCILIYVQMYAAYRLLSSERRMGWGMAFFLLFACGLFTGVRKAFFVPMIFVYVYLLIQSRKSALKIIGTTVLAGALAALSLFIVSQYFTSLASRLGSLLSDILSGVEAVSSGGNSYEERLWLMQTAWQAFTENPVLGLGVGQFRVYSVAHGGPNLYAHNNFLELMANSGLFGFVLYYGAIALLIRSLWKRLDSSDGELSRFCAFGISFMVSVLVMEYGQVDYYQPYFLIFPFLISTFVQSLKNGERKGGLEVIGKEGR